MIKKLVFLTLCIASSLAAENIGNIEYHLPIGCKDWQMGNIPDPDGADVAIMYTPKNKEKEDEGFCVSMDKRDLNSNLKTFINELHPDIKILSEDDQSAMLEYSYLDRYCLLRIFLTPNDVIMLLYVNTTENRENINRAKKNWVPALQEAKLLSSSEK